jgi:hypothetical protein
MAQPFNPAAFIGKIAAFYPAPGMVKYGLPVPGAKRLVGEVVGAMPAPTGPSGIPSATLTIRGRTGRSLAVDSVECYVQLFTSWKEGLQNAN